MGKIKFIFVAAFFATSCLFGLEVSSESKKVFAFEVGYVGLWRSPLKTMDFLYSDSSGQTVLHKMNFGYVSGVRGLLEFNIGPKNTLEAVYTGFFNWRTEDSATDSSYSLNVPTNPYTNVNWTDFYYLHYNYKSGLNSGELSYWRHFTPRYVDYFCFSWMLGVRYINFRDSIHLINGTGYSTGDTASVKVLNQMVGAQGGLELQCNASRWFLWALQVKGGAYADFVWKRDDFNDQNNSVKLVDNSESRVISTSTLELIPYIMFRFNPIYFKIAYDRIIMFNPAFAPLQIHPDKSLNDVFRHNYVNFQAVYASVGFYW